jgi:carboxymethylenebutenolidase
MAAEPFIHTVPPPGGTGPAVLVLPAWWGLNAFFKKLCGRLAKQGFVVVAPDLYHGAVATTIAEARRLRGQVKRPAAQSDILQGVKRAQALSSQPDSPIGVVGYSMGGHYALWLAEQAQVPVAATVTYYATRGGDYAGTRSAFLGHFAEQDEYVAASGVAKLRKTLERAAVPAEFYTYPGTGHWFAEEDRPDAYQPAAATLAWKRTLAFLKARLA